MWNKAAKSSFMKRDTGGPESARHANRDGALKD
jgi:hypothetical protein